MIAFILLPIYIALNFLVYKALINWLTTCHELFETKILKIVLVSIQTFLSASILVAFFLPDGRFKQIFGFIGNYWIGIMIYILLVVIVTLLGWFLVWHKLVKDNKISRSKYHILTGFICIAIISIVSTYGIINSRIIRTTYYDITIDKEANNFGNLKIVMVADFHLGYNIGYKQIERTVEKINAQDPDIVVIAGDIFDNSYDAIDNPQKVLNALKNIKSKCGVYAVYGNHDIDEKVLAGFTFNYSEKNKQSDLRMDELLESANIQLLRDEYVLINDSIYLYGRPDYLKPGRGIEERKNADEITCDLDKEKPIILIDHEPRELKELAKAGIDLDLSGYTHDGQIFPLTVFVNFSYDNVCGLKKYGKMSSIVTSGVGVYGPNMRVGTVPEITCINVKFGK